VTQNDSAPDRNAARQVGKERQTATRRIAEIGPHRAGGPVPGHARHADEDLSAGMSPRDVTENAVGGNPRDIAGGHDFEPLVSVTEVATVFGRSERTIRRWVRVGKLPTVRVGASMFFRREDVSVAIRSGLERGFVSPRPCSNSNENRSDAMVSTNAINRL